LCGVVIYRHLNISQKREVMKMIHATKDPKIIGALTTKITDITISPHWGLWSQSKAELAEAKKYYQFILTVGSSIGLTVSANGLKGFLSELWKTGKVTPVGALLIVVWAGLYADQIILENINNELDSRKQFIKTKPY